MLALFLFLYGLSLTLHTDHEALQRLLKLDGASGWMAWLRLALLEYKYGMQYRPGTRQQLADGVSRLRTDGREDIILGNKVSYFSAEPTADARSKQQPAFGMWNDCDDHSNCRAWMPRVLVSEETNVTPGTVDRISQE